MFSKTLWFRIVYYILSARAEGQKWLRILLESNKVPSAVIGKGYSGSFRIVESSGVAIVKGAIVRN